MASRTVRGVRTPIPPGFLVGRAAGSGTGAAQVVSITDIAQQIANIGIAGPATGGPAPAVYPLALSLGGTHADLSATGGAHYVLKQSSSGANITVGQLAASDLTGLAAVATSGSASDLSSGTLPSGRLTGSYTGITGVGTIGTGTWQGSIITLTYGGTGADLHLTGGANELVKQSTVGGVFTVGTLTSGETNAGLDAIGATEGDILARGASTWGVVAPGRNSFMSLYTGGSGALPFWNYAAGRSLHPSVSFATAVALPACTYNNGTNGIGATLTANVNSGLGTIDGIVTSSLTPSPVGYSLIVKNQVDATQNGIYLITVEGDGSTKWVLTRRADADQATNDAALFNFESADTWFVDGGTANGSTMWMVHHDGAAPNIKVGTVNWTFDQLAGVSATSGAAYFQIVSPAANDVLQYNAGTGKFDNVTLSAAIDAALGSTQGSILYRGASLWTPLTPGVSGQALLTQGAGADPVWGAIAQGAGGGAFSGALSALPTKSGTTLNTALGGATITDTAAGVLITGTSGSGAYTTTVPGTPTYSITALIACAQIASVPGFGWTDGTKIHFCYTTPFGSGDRRFLVQRNSNITSFSATDVSTPTYYLSEQQWFKIRDDGTTVYFMFGVDGINFFTFFSVAKSSGYLGSGGYTHIFVGSPGGSGAEDNTVLSWTVGL